ncbi:MAG: hypothetical protein GX677_06970 [Treponema sp.]|nr:hypothetical protein [Treponema sp.]
MQELRSTEILDKEIQSDARKKAENILKKADSDCENILSSVNENLDVAKKEKEALYKNKIKAYKNNQDAAIPLEKQRFEVQFIQDSITKEINEYLVSLSEDERMELIMKDLNNKMSLLKDKKVNSYVYGFDLKDISAKLKKNLGANLLKCEKTDFGRMIVEDECKLEINEGVILESEDKQFRFRLTLSEIISEIMKKYRMELTESLFGGNI